MPSNATLGSYLGTLVEKRNKLSAIRQRLNMEQGPGLPGGAAVRELAPSPPGGPAAAPNPAQAAGAFDPTTMDIPPEKKQVMLAKIQEFIDQHGEQQQQLIDQSKQGAPQGAAPPQGDVATAQALAQPTARTGAKPAKGDIVQLGLRPLTEFYQATGRLPTPEEYRVLKAAALLRQQMGREPSQDEIRLYLSKPEV